MARDLLSRPGNPYGALPMRSWWIPSVLLLAAACSSDNRNAPGVPPDVPASLSSTSLDGAIALTWTDNSYTADPGIFQNYRVYSTSYDLDQNLCGTSWQLGAAR